MVDGPFDKLKKAFVSDALFDGRQLSALTIVDVFTREALAIDVDQATKGELVVEAVARISSIRRRAQDHSRGQWPEFISKALDRWAEQPKVPALRSFVGMATEGYENGVTLDFSRPGKPIDYAFVEAFNGRLRDDCLNAHWFLSIADARAKRPGDGTITRGVLTHRLAG